MTTVEKRFGEYDGGCHCGYISFSFKVSPPLDEYRITHCNCSVCRRLGYLFIYPKYENVTWHNGSKERCSVYQFNTKSKDHLFCPKCGASIGIDFRSADPKFWGISARTLHGIDLDKLIYQKGDGLNNVKPAGDLSGRHNGKDAVL